MSDIHSIVLKHSDEMPSGVNTAVKGYDFNKGLDYDALLASYHATGIQASNFGLAVNIVNEMIRTKNLPLPPGSGDVRLRNQTNCTIYLGYTSNMISSGIREIIRYLAQHNLVDVIVSSAGGVEEDFIKCMNPSYVGSFHKYDDATLREKGINRIGNMLIANNNYIVLEEWLMPILGKMHQEQISEGVNWTPSKIIRRLGKEISNEESVYYWCYKNDIPVFCPAITDGSIGDMIFFYNRSNPGFRVDLVEDIDHMNSTAINAKNSGMIILGGGIIKHHIANANLMRNGADFSLYINTGSEFESSDSGAPPEEAISWGKIKAKSEPIKLFSEVSLVFPLIVAQTFVKDMERKSKGL